MILTNLADPEKRFEQTRETVASWLAPEFPFCIVVEDVVLLLSYISKVRKGGWRRYQASELATRNQLPRRVRWSPISSPKKPPLSSNVISLTVLS
jgi:hypothetical protein